jgi:hypothetical protein
MPKLINAFWNSRTSRKKWHRYFTSRVYRSKESPCSEGSSCSAGQEIPRTLLMPRVHYRVHKSPRNTCALRYVDTTCKLVAPRTKPAVAPSVPTSHVSPSLMQVILGYMMYQRQASWSEVRTQCRSVKRSISPLTNRWHTSGTGHVGR